MPALYFAWPKLKCFCHPWLTLLLPQQKFAHVSMRRRTFSSRPRVEKNTHIKKLTKYHLQLKQVCNMYVWCTWVFVNNGAYCATIPYHLKCLMRSSEVPLNYITVFDGQFLWKYTCKHCNVEGISPYLELRPCRLTICDHPKPTCVCSPLTVIKML